jgi:hypothetical protein
MMQFSYDYYHFERKNDFCKQTVTFETEMLKILINVHYVGYIPSA